MAFRAAQTSRPAPPLRAGSDPPPATVLAVDGGYHGDTLGAMDATPPSIFNVGQTPWYAPRGLFVDPPTAGRGARGWTVRPPPSAPGTDAVVEGGLDELFDGSRAAGPVGRAYRASIDAAIDAHEASRAGRLGALLFEPVLKGAGGMRFIDPAWQVGGEGEGWRG